MQETKIGPKVLLMVVFLFCSTAVAQGADANGYCGKDGTPGELESSDYTGANDEQGQQYPDSLVTSDYDNGYVDDRIDDHYGYAEDSDGAVDDYSSQQSDSDNLDYKNNDEDYSNPSDTSSFEYDL